MCVAGNISGALAPLIYGMFGANSLWRDAFFDKCDIKLHLISVSFQILKSFKCMRSSALSK